MDLADAQAVGPNIPGHFQFPENKYVANCSSKEISKSNFRQYGQMKKQRWEESERRREEERKSEKKQIRRKGARKGRKIAKQDVFIVFPMFWGCGGLQNRLAKAVGSEQSGEMRDENFARHVA